MTRQVIKVPQPGLNAHGIWRVIREDGNVNPYKIVFEADGHSHIKERYGDLYSCICYLNDLNIFRQD